MKGRHLQSSLGVLALGMLYLALPTAQTPAERGRGNGEWRFSWRRRPDSVLSARPGDGR